VPVSMCNWRVSVDDIRRCHWTPSQAEPTSTPETIGDQHQSGGPSKHCHCSGARGIGLGSLDSWPTRRASYVQQTQERGLSTLSIGLGTTVAADDVGESPGFVVERASPGGTEVKGSQEVVIVAMMAASSPSSSTDSAQRSSTSTEMAVKSSLASATLFRRSRNRVSLSLRSSEVAQKLWTRF
jgi:hypothetical protein